MISPGRDRSQPGYHPTSTGSSRTDQYRRSRSAENRRESNPVSAMRDTDYQAGQQQAAKFHSQHQYQQQQQQQHHRQALQGAGVGPGPALRVPLNQVC